MRAPAFWNKDTPTNPARLLAPAAWLWAQIAKVRLARRGARVGVPVICVGNFVAGGAGKTPTALALARILQAQGERPVFLTRGYGGALSSQIPLRVDPSIHASLNVGDESLLLAALAPTIVCIDRAAGAREAVRLNASVIVMDDGMQNPSLEKDITLAVIDGAVGVGNGLCMPAGPLRAPLAAQDFSALLVIGPGAAGDNAARRLADERLVFRASLVADAQVARTLNGKAVVAFAGIGRPKKFFDTLAQTGARVISRYSFADHHGYTANEIERLKSVAADCDGALDAQGSAATKEPALLVTTEKDYVRLAPSQRDGIMALPAELAFADKEAFARWLIGALGRIRGSS